MRHLRIALAAIVLLLFVFAVLAGVPLLSEWAQYNAVAVNLPQWQFLPAALSAYHGVCLGVLALIALVLLTLLLGRVYCSVLCPLGILQDIVWWVRSKVLPKRFLRYTTAVPYMRYVMLLLCVGAVVLGYAGVVLAWADPYSIFYRSIYSLTQPVATWMNNYVATHSGGALMAGEYMNYSGVMMGVSALLMLVVTALAAWRGRLYCNTYCPVGALLGLLARFSLFRLSFSPDACKKCLKCLKSCKAQCLDLKTMQIDSSRCVMCYNCVQSCDERGIGYVPFWRVKSLAPKQKPQNKVEAQVSATIAEITNPYSAESPAAVTRREFLSGSALGVFSMFMAGCNLSRGADLGLDPNKSILPPGAISLDHFLDTCTGCQLCVSACPFHVLQPAGLELGVRGFMKPRMDFRKKYCRYDCKVCSDVCPTGALKKMTMQEKETTQIAVATFYKCRCLVYREGWDCGACTEHCPTKALDTVETDIILHGFPSINMDKCIVCGKCVRACSYGALKIVHGKDEENDGTLVLNESICSNCGACAKACNRFKAITMPQPVKALLPKLNQDLCIGCGACEFACPVTVEEECVKNAWGKCTSCGIDCEFEKMKPPTMPSRAIMIRAVNPQRQIRKHVEEKAVDPNAGEDFPF